MSWTREDKLILASASPRRADLLDLAGIPFRRMVSGVSEDVDAPVDPEDHVVELSRRKARDVAQRLSSGVVLGADTVVVLDGEILGKPAGKREAAAMLRKLNGRTHQVYTGLTLIDVAGDIWISHVERTEVTFRELADEEIAEYVATGEPLDKAGAYGIQGRGALLISGIDGCFYNVVGLPLVGLLGMIRRLDSEVGKG
ncbi:septum formation inhibitor Maf [bacterium]|nr:septum formation inhibitor Maf [bacterium]MCK4597094.1 septum formation inhibitor Maf [bacterium]